MALAADTFASVKFSTAGLAPGKRLTAYREMLDRSVGSNLDMEPTEDRFDFSANSLVLPGLGVTQISSTALRVGLRRGASADEKRDLLLAVMHDGTATHTRGIER